MLAYYLRLSIIRLRKNPAFTMLNILGLCIGFAAFFILYLHVKNEDSYDKHFNDHANIYRVVSTPGHINNEWSDAWARSLGFIKDESRKFPEVEMACRFSHSKAEILEIDGKQFEQGDVLSVDQEFLEMFSVESINGNLKDLQKPNIAFISERFATKYFENKNPIGENISIDRMGEYQVAGIVKNTAPKSHFNYELLLSQKGSLEDRYKRLNDRKTHWVYSYLKLKNNANPTDVADKIRTWYNQSSYKDKPGPREYSFRLLKMTDIHLKSNHRFEMKESNSKININLFTIIAFVILAVTLINFISLLTIDLLKRSKEFGLKQTVGARKKQLISQFVVEVFIFCFISIAASILAIEMIKGSISQFYDIEFSIFYTEPFIYQSILFILILCSGMSALSIRFFILKEDSTDQMIKSSILRKGKRILQPLIIFQISIVIILFASTLLVNKQISFILDKPLGFEKENIVVLRIKDFSKDPHVFADELKKKSHIESVGFTLQHFGYPTQTIPLEGLGIEGTSEMSLANYDFLKTMNLQFVSSRINPAKDTIEGMVINEHLYKRLMEKHKSMHELELYLAGKPLEENQIRFNIVGVVKDFNYSSTHQEIGDYMFILGESSRWARFTHIRIAAGNTRTAMEEIRAEWNKFYPHQKMQYFFMDDKVNQQYKSEYILRKILLSFSLAGLLIGIMGISALAFFTAQLRTKEIGIRKANGAKTNQIVQMLNRDFTIWVLVAFLIASPISWYAMNQWLQNFAYKTALSWWIFASAGIIALGIALLTVSWQSWRAARRNPVESLRYE